MIQIMFLSALTLMYALIIFTSIYLFNNYVIALIAFAAAVSAAMQAVFLHKQYICHINNMTAVATMYGVVFTIMTVVIPMYERFALVQTANSLTICGELCRRCPDDVNNYKVISMRFAAWIIMNIIIGIYGVITPPLCAVFPYLSWNETMQAWATNGQSLIIV
jgi:hypothetical protein